MAVRTVFTIVLGAILLHTVNGQHTNMDPKMNITSTDPPSDGHRVRGYITKAVTLNCMVENIPEGLQVWWVRSVINHEGREAMQVISKDMDVQDMNKWSIEKPTPYSWRLRIKALQVADEGNYTCYIQLTIENRVEANRTVLVTDPPVIIEAQTSNDLQIREGETLTLQCNATGRPRPTFTWRRQGKSILPGGGVILFQQSMEFTDIHYKARGVYICEVYNEVGFTSREVQVRVQFSPKVFPNRDRIGQAPGYKRTLICHVEANPAPSVSKEHNQLLWYRNKYVLTPDGQRVFMRALEGAYGRITFELVINAIREEDYGMYTCQAQNSMGRSQADVELYKTDAPVHDKGYIGSPASTLSPFLASLCISLVVSTLLSTMT